MVNEAMKLPPQMQSEAELDLSHGEHVSPRLVSNSPGADLGWTTDTFLQFKYERPFTQLSASPPFSLKYNV